MALDKAFDRTYEGLKPEMTSLHDTTGHAFDRTYEGLKHVWPDYTRKAAESF